MLGDGDLDDDDSNDENLPEVDLLEQLSKLQIGSDVPEDETISKASSKVMLRSNPVFDEKRVSSKVSLYSILDAFETERNALNFSLFDYYSEKLHTNDAWK